MNYKRSIVKKYSELFKNIKIFKIDGGIFILKIDDPESLNLLSESLISDLIIALENLRERNDVKVVIIEGGKDNFIRGGLSELNAVIENKLLNKIIECPYPIIASMQGDATGVGFLIGALSDFMICSLESTYYYSCPELYLSLKDEIISVFEKRLGYRKAINFLTSSNKYSGSSLKEIGWNCRIVNSADVEINSINLSKQLANNELEPISHLKKHLSRDILKNVNRITIDKQKLSEKTIQGNGEVDKLKVVFDFVRIRSQKDGILRLEFIKNGTDYSYEMLYNALEDILNRSKKYSKIKTIIFDFKTLPIEMESIENTENFVLKIIELLRNYHLPLVSIFRNDLNYSNWILSLSFDSIVYVDSIKCNLDHLWQSKRLSIEAANIFNFRFSQHFSKEILFGDKSYTGKDISLRELTIYSAAESDVFKIALNRAIEIAKLPVNIITSIKKYTNKYVASRNVVDFVDNKMPQKLMRDSKGVDFSLSSDVVKMSIVENGIAKIKMEDKKAKNMFSEALIDGLTEAFDYVNSSENIKVVILTGYGSYFSSGGTKESLVEIQKGKQKFTDNKFYSLPLTCKVPVVALMQGHGIGGGWSLGMYSDFVVFTNESKYLNPYVNYGFTPGAGATFLFPEKIGYDLSRETLMTGVEINGVELAGRGIDYPVYPRKQSYDEVLKFAKSIAEKPLFFVKTIKLITSNYIAEAIEDIYRLELEMHEKTFVAKSNTLKNIEMNFFTKDNMSAVNKQSYNINIKVNSKVSMMNVINKLKEFFAEELHMNVGDVDEDMQFVDLGLDSIAGVTWVRKINEYFNTEIDTTKIYSYPTIKKLAKYVKGKSEKSNGYDRLINENTESIKCELTNSETLVNVDSLDVKSVIKSYLADELHMDTDEVDEHAQFVDLGLDSIAGVSWIRKINDRFNTSIDSTKIYSYPTLEKFFKYVKSETPEKLVKDEIKSELSASKINVQSTEKRSVGFMKTTKKLKSKRHLWAKPVTNKNISKSQSIAVIGIAGQFPQANDVDEYWNNIAMGRNCISEVKENRWDTSRFYEGGKITKGKTISKWMGMIEDYDKFDPLFFNISPTEAISMDPQQRLFLKTCWDVIENSGYSADKFSGSKCGVFVGCVNSDYNLLSNDLQESAHGFTGDAIAMLAARIAYFLNLKGPCLSIDTACSSSLVALATACDSLAAGNSDTAIAGGVYVMTGPKMHIRTSQAGMLSPDGKCYTFDNRANGLVPGEAVGAVLLKRLDDAERDNDNILGVIKGWGINQDGKTNGITAPSAESQKELQQEVYEKFDIDVEAISLIETHGTGTKLGDPIEIAALKDSFKKYTKKDNYCALGSVKSNIGHCLTAAGITGFIKLILSFKNRQLPPTINFENLNEHIDLKNSPFYVNNILKKWDVPGQTNRCSAISSFGFSGTNAHMILEEYIDKVKPNNSIKVQKEDGDFIVPISARTKEHLYQKVNDLIVYLKNNDECNLIELSYTLQIGRKSMDHRVGFMVKSTSQLLSMLESYVENENASSGMMLRNEEYKKDIVNSLIQDEAYAKKEIDKKIISNNLSELLKLWVNGLDIDWDQLYGITKPKRLELPLYPFAKEKYWIQLDKEANNSTISNIHPLISENVSTFKEQRYCTRFMGNELYLKDHKIKVDGNKFRQTLPGVAYLEIVRAAIEDAMKINEQLINIELINTAWVRPVFVEKESEIFISLCPMNEKIDGVEQISYEVTSINSGQELVHCKGMVIVNENYIDKNEILKIDEIENRMERGVILKSDIYQSFTKMGFDYGPSHQCIEEIKMGKDELIAKLKAPSTLSGLEDIANGKFVIQLGMVDSALQSSIGLSDKIEDLYNKPLLPFAMDSLLILDCLDEELDIWLRKTKDEINQTNIVKLDLDICNKDGKVCMKIRGFTSRLIDLSESQGEKDLKIDNLEKDTSEFNSLMYKDIIEKIMNNEVSIDEAIEIE